MGWAGSQGQDTTSDCWLGKRPLGSLPLCLCLLGPPCLSISLSFVVCRRPSQLSGPHQPSLTSLLLRCRPTSASRRPLLCPPASFPAGLWAPASAHLSPLPSCPHPMLVSVCQRDLSGHRPKGWEDSPAACPPGTSAAAGRGRASLKVNGCCLAAPMASIGPQGHDCVLHHPQLRPSCRKPSKAASL